MNFKVYVDNNNCNIIGLVECTKFTKAWVNKVISTDITDDNYKEIQKLFKTLPSGVLDEINDIASNAFRATKVKLIEKQTNLKDIISKLPNEENYIFILPKNFSDEWKEEETKEFKLEFEKFVHTFMSKQSKQKSPIVIKKPNEAGSFDETILHSDKYEIWYRLENMLKVSIKNKSSRIHRYTDVFNSKSIERTISRGTFLLSQNNSPVFNQGLLTPDTAYRVHAKDELYKLGSFILDQYGTTLAIKENIPSIFKLLSNEFKKQYGFKQGIDYYNKNDQNKLILILENTIKKIQPISEDIKELINSIKNMIFGKDAFVTIDNFHLAWEDLVAGALENAYPNAQVFTEKDMCIYKDNGYCYNYGIYPDIVMIENGILNIFDPKYKNSDSESRGDWIKQFLYVNQFLIPAFNPIENNLKVNTSLIHIYPTDESSYMEDSIELDLNKGIASNRKKIFLNVFDLLKSYNNKEESSTFDILFKENCLNFSNNRNDKLWIPSCCYLDNSNKMRGTFDNKDGKYWKYFDEYLVKNDYIENSSPLKYFKIKKIKKDNNGKYTFIALTST
jgi:hypothetical protein